MNFTNSKAPEQARKDSHNHPTVGTVQVPKHNQGTTLLLWLKYYHAYSSTLPRLEKLKHLSEVSSWRYLYLSAKTTFYFYLLHTSCIYCMWPMQSDAALFSDRRRCYWEAMCTQITRIFPSDRDFNLSILPHNMASEQEVADNRTSAVISTEEELYHSFR